MTWMTQASLKDIRERLAINLYPRTSFTTLSLIHFLRLDINPLIFPQSINSKQYKND